VAAPYTLRKQYGYGDYGNSMAYVRRKYTSGYEDAQTFDNVNLLPPERLIGVNSMIGGSKRNMNNDIRGEVSLPPLDQGPYVGSSILQDGTHTTLSFSNPYNPNA
jgi:hypothetical protein